MKPEVFFRRPKTYPSIRDAKAEMAVKRAVEAGKVKQVKFNYYYVEGWWNRLSLDKWKVQDAILYLALGLGKRFSGGEPLSPNVDSDPNLLRREIKFLRLIANVAGGIADELENRAEALDIERSESETEVTD